MRSPRCEPEVDRQIRERILASSDSQLLSRLRRMRNPSNLAAFIRVGDHQHAADALLDGAGRELRLGGRAQGACPSPEAALALACQPAGPALISARAPAQSFPNDFVFLAGIARLRQAGRGRGSAAPAGYCDGSKQCRGANRRGATAGGRTRGGQATCQKAPAESYRCRRCSW